MILKRKQKEALVLQVGQCLVAVTAGKREGAELDADNEYPLVVTALGANSLSS